MQAQATDAHRVRSGGDGLRAEVLEKGIVGRFDDAGAELSSLQNSGVQGHLRLATIGRSSGERQAVGAATPVASDHAVRWERPAGGSSLEETWQAGPLGLEHRVVVRSKPAGQGSVELTLEVSGLEAEQDGEQIRLQAQPGAGGLVMTDYFVRDASGKLLAGRMGVRDGKVVYEFDDRGAEYPVEVDPLTATQQARFQGNDTAKIDKLGMSVSLSSDGMTALVGASQEDDTGTTDNGAAYVFTRAGNAWSQQAKLLASDKATNDKFGYTVALSGDGTTALIGASLEDDSGTVDSGAAYVFTRSGNSWFQQAKLLASDKANGDEFGWSLALSSDGSTAVVGAYNDDDVGLTNNGAVYVFTRTANVWSQQTKILADDKDNNELFGWSVSLSSDGSTALIGAIVEDDSGLTNNGAAYVFTRVGVVWSQQAKLLASDKETNDDFGFAVALSSSGSTALISATTEDDSGTTDNGAVYVFTRTGNAWSQQAKLLASDKANNDGFGAAVSLSSDGNIAMVGAGGEDEGMTNNGAAYVFTRTGGAWSQQKKIWADDKIAFSNFGTSISLSSDGSTSLIGCPGGGTTQGGAAYVFEIGSGKPNGDACNAPEECSSGVCVDGVCCNTACSAGVCDACSVAAGAAVNGVCSLFTGNSCNDNDACTQGDTCQAGVCSGSSAVTCSAQDACHDAGACNPATGACTNPAKPDATACDDGNACTTGDSCQAGQCIPGPGVTCIPGECQESAGCVPASGACQFADKPDGTPCASGVCSSGTCVGAGGSGGAGSGGSSAGGEAGAGSGGVSSGGSSAAGSSAAGNPGAGGAAAGSGGEAGSGEAGSAGASTSGAGGSDAGAGGDAGSGSDAGAGGSGAGAAGASAGNAGAGPSGAGGTDPGGAAGAGEAGAGASAGATAGGGTSSGGASAGGTSAGGASAGGASTGGATTGGGTSSGGASAGGAGPVLCTPGQQVTCACAGTALQGVQVCKSDGKGLGPCTGCPTGQQGGNAGSPGAGGAGLAGSGAGGATPGASAASSDDGGCSVQTTGERREPPSFWGLALAALGLAVVRRRRAA